MITFVLYYLLVLAIYAVVLTFAAWGARELLIWGEFVKPKGITWKRGFKATPHALFGGQPLRHRGSDTKAKYDANDNHRWMTFAGFLVVVFIVFCDHPGPTIFCEAREQPAQVFNSGQREQGSLLIERFLWGSTKNNEGVVVAKAPPGKIAALFKLELCQSAFWRNTLLLTFVLLALFTAFAFGDDLKASFKLAWDSHKERQVERAKRKQEVAQVLAQAATGGSKKKGNNPPAPANDHGIPWYENPMTHFLTGMASEFASRRMFGKGA